MTQRANSLAANDIVLEHAPSTATDASPTTAIIVTYHTGKALWLCIDSVLAQEHVEQLIIVDNGNPTEVQQQLKQLRELRPRITLLQGHGNIGFSRACNLAASIAAHPMLAFINPDCLLPQHAVAQMQASMRQHPNVWLAGAKLIFPNGTEQRGSRRQLLTPRNAIIEGAKLHKLFPKRFGAGRMNLHQSDAWQEATEVPAISGAFMMIQRIHYQSLHGMDDGFFLHVEDLDLCYRVQQAGGGVLYVPDVSVTHFLSTSDSSSAKVEWFKARGFIHYFRKHFAGNAPKRLLWPMYGLVWAQFFARISASLLKRLARMHVNPAADAEIKRLYLLKDGLSKDEPICYGASAHLRDEGPVMVTGATSPLGLASMRHLLAANIEVMATRHKRVMHLNHPSVTWLDAHFERGELDLDGTAPTTVIHTAGIWFISPALIERFHRAGVKHIVAFSSTSIEGKRQSHTPHERDMVQGLKKGEQMLAAECDLRGMQWTILRPTMIYGYGLDANITRLKRFIMRYRFFPICPPAQGKRQPVHVDDLAKAAMSVLGRKRCSGKTYNVSGGEVMTYREMLCRIFESANIKPRLLPIKFLPHILSTLAIITRSTRITPDMARRMNTDLNFSHSKAQDDFNYSPRNFTI